MGRQRLERSLPTLPSSMPLRPSNSHCGIKLKARPGLVRNPRMAQARERRSSQVRENSVCASASPQGERRTSTVLRTLPALLQGATQTPTRCTGRSISNVYKSSKAISTRKASHEHCRALSMRRWYRPVPKGTAMRETTVPSVLLPPSWRL